MFSLANEQFCLYCILFVNVIGAVSPVDVIVDCDVVAVVVVVRLLRLNLAVACPHHHMSVVQKHLADAVLFMIDSYKLAIGVKSDT